MEKLNQILDLIDGLTILELKDLVKALEEKYGVSAAPVAVAAAPGAAVAEVDGCIGLDHVVGDRAVVCGKRYFSVKGTDDTKGYGLSISKRITDGDGPVTNLNRIRVTEFSN